ncbi:MAG TPA: peptide ABC transporter substrate-binding protein, partial [Candidatus Limnocylindrales bacterium]|nr:peptide ABC transporter substrate-binding protein [Candidatus Limnocylindrales bacterium]
MRRRVSVLLIVLLVAACGGPSISGRSDASARIVLGAPSDLDPARTGDAESSAVVAQLFETLTTFDASLELRPALAESWRVEDEGRRVVFRLRPDLTFSDGSPLGASDVVRSWFRVIDPDHSSPLVTLLADVKGALAFADREAAAGDVGIRADDGRRELTVDMERAAADFPAIVASPTFAVVPTSIDDRDALTASSDFVGSGGYRLVAEGPTDMTLEANTRYWAGPPAIGTITLITTLQGASPVDRFEADDVDYVSISSADARWIAYDRELGPRLLAIPSMSTDYYGFDTTEAPFDDVRVRQAFGAAVDWRRIAELAVDDPAAVATSMVPPGIPERSDADMLPRHDPEAARALMGAAGYRNGNGFPRVTLVTGGSPYDEAIVDELERELGITIDQEAMPFDEYFPRLDTDPPQMWFLSWVADYPGRNDFLGVLLGSDSVNNYGRWRSAEFDAAIAEAASTTDVAAARAAF